MPDTVIRIEHLSKQYRLGVINSGRLISDLQSWWAQARGKEDPNSVVGNGGSNGTKNGRGDKIWALKDVSFEVARGERLGIIGRNGAGKSTLLKILSRVTTPTQGLVKVKGHVASLLEVGTGFNPELTGRENIFLNGAILGMTKAEVKKRFDEIVAFAEVETFVDTPVKRYSSGMYVRLAFAVAAHLEPDVLVVDEVLAVGDASFQKKCLGKMEDVSTREGRAVLFVSHNMNAVRQLCNHAMVIDQGRIVQPVVQTDIAVDRYNLMNLSTSEYNNSAWSARAGDPKNEYFEPMEFCLTDESGKRLESSVPNTTAICVNIKFRCRIIDEALVFGYALYDQNDVLLYSSHPTDDAEERWSRPTVGENTFVTEIPRRFLNEGRYSLELVAALNHRMYILEPGQHRITITFEISGGLSDSPQYVFKRPGVLAPILRWKRIKQSQI